MLEVARSPHFFPHPHGQHHGAGGPRRTQPLTRASILSGGDRRLQEASTTTCVDIRLMPAQGQGADHHFSDWLRV